MNSKPNKKHIFFKYKNVWSKCLSASICELSELFRVCVFLMFLIFKFIGQCRLNVYILEMYIIYMMRRNDASKKESEGERERNKNECVRERTQIQSIKQN